MGRDKRPMPFLTGTENIEGELVQEQASIDIVLRLAGGRRTIRASIDTGCGDPLVFSSYTHATSLGLTFRTSLHAKRIDRQLVDGTMCAFVEGWATIEWFGERTIPILAPDPRAPLIDPIAASYLPEALIGQDLLLNCSLTIEFRPNGRVLIARL